MSDNFFFVEGSDFFTSENDFLIPPKRITYQKQTLNKTFGNGQKFEPYFWWKFGIWKVCYKEWTNVWMKKFFARGTQYLSDGWLRKFVLISQFLISGPNYLNMPANFMESNSGTKSPMLTVSPAMMLMTLLRTMLLRPKNVSNIAIVYKF